MKKKLVAILLIVLLLLIIIFISFCIIISTSFKLKGDKEIYLNYNDKYEELGYSTKFNNKVKIINNINLNKIGEYQIVYELKYLFITFKRYRTIHIIDKVSPVIKLNGEKNTVICPNDTYQEEGFTAIDEYDGDLTDKVKITTTNNSIMYEVNDSSNNIIKVERIIEKKDNEKPKITLNGKDNINVLVNTDYKDLGYTVSDNCTKDVKVSVNSNLNTKQVGKYTITYTATDDSNNTSSVVRYINVYKPKEPGSGTIYLTFDDGPSSSGSTEKILNILKKYGIKATFFVVGSGNDALIRREFNEGHKLALHTNTHVYSQVYSSVDNYFADLKRIDDKVYNITGTRTNIIRFPGGSSNTISNRYTKGIMNTLVHEVLDRGYYYVDWNISSGDAGGCNNSNCVYTNTVNNLSKSRANVVLMHDIKLITANALESIINYAINNGYSFKTIDTSMPIVRFK